MQPLLGMVKTKFTLALLGVILAVGGIAMAWIITGADRQLREDLLIQERLVIQTLEVEQIKALSGSPDDLASPDYQHLKAFLTTVRAADPRYRFLYLLGRQSDGALFFYLDSEPADSPDYSPPGQIYAESTADDRRVFDHGTAIVEGPVSDRWGTWVSALVPLVDPATGAVVAVAGMDVSRR